MYKFFRRRNPALKKNSNKINDLQVLTGSDGRNRRSCSMGDVQIFQAPKSGPEEKLKQNQRFSERKRRIDFLCSR